MAGELESNLGIEELKNGKLLTPYKIKPGWTDALENLTPGVSAALIDVKSWFKEPWTPVACRIGSAEEPILDVVMGFNNPQLKPPEIVRGLFSKRRFTDLFSTLTDTMLSQSYGKSWVGNSGTDMIPWQIHLSPERVGLFPYLKLQPDQTENVVVVSRVDVKQFQLYDFDKMPEGTCVPSRLMVNMNMVNLLIQKTGPISLLKAQKDDLDSRLQQLTNSSQEAITKLSQIPAIY